MAENEKLEAATRLEKLLDNIAGGDNEITPATRLEKFLGYIADYVEDISGGSGGGGIATPIYFTGDYNDFSNEEGRYSYSGDNISIKYLSTDLDVDINIDQLAIGIKNGYYIPYIKIPDDDLLAVVSITSEPNLLCLRTLPVSECDVANSNYEIAVANNSNTDAYFLVNHCWCVTINYNPFGSNNVVLTNYSSFDSDTAKPVGMVKRYMER